jgi:hypothetical protein
MSITVNICFNKPVTNDIPNWLLWNTSHACLSKHITAQLVGLPYLPILSSSVVYCAGRGHSHTVPTHRTRNVHDIPHVLGCILCAFCPESVHNCSIYWLVLYSGSTQPARRHIWLTLLCTRGKLPCRICYYVRRFGVHGPKFRTWTGQCGTR